MSITPSYIYLCFTLLSYLLKTLYGYLVCVGVHLGEVGYHSGARAIIAESFLPQADLFFIKHHHNNLASNLSHSTLDHAELHHISQHIAIMELPVEMWMHVFEYIQRNEMYARPHYVQAYCAAVNAAQNATDGEEDTRQRNAIAKFPEFGMQTHQATRQYYKINQNSRVAAIQLQLSTLLLRTCTPPLKHFDNKIHPHPDLQQSNTAVFELFDPATFERQLKDCERIDNIFRRTLVRPVVFSHKRGLEYTFREHWHDLIVGNNVFLSFGKVRRVVLLVAPPVEGFDITANECVDRFVGCIEGYCKRLGIEGDVECWE